MLMPVLVLSSARNRCQTSSGCYSRSLLLLQILLLLVVLLAVPSSGFHLATTTTSEGGMVAATRETFPGRYKNYQNPKKQSTTTRRSSPSSSSTLLLLFSNSQNPETTDQDPVLRLPLMEAELATLMEDNNNNNKRESLNSIQRQEELQELISNAKTAAEFGVRKAQLEFYDAFSRGDIDAMENVWSTQSHVRCVHPGMVSLDGRDKVMASWRQIFQASSSDVGDDIGDDDDDDDSSSFEIEPVRSQVEVHGLIALCSCVEKTEGGGSLEALNVYKREEGAWKMTLHMASPTMVSIRGGGAFF